MLSTNKGSKLARWVESWLAPAAADFYCSIAHHRLKAVFLQQ